MEGGGSNLHPHRHESMHTTYTHTRHTHIHTQYTHCVNRPAPRFPDTTMNHYIHKTTIVTSLLYIPRLSLLS